VLLSFKRDYHNNVRLDKSRIAGKRKNRRGNSKGFETFQGLLKLLIYVNRHALLQRKRMEIAFFLPTAAGQFCFLPYWLTASSFPGFVIIPSQQEHLPSRRLCDLAFPSSFPIPFKNCPETIQHPLGIPQRLSSTFLTVPSGCSIA
jgi:hypothetical protein